MKGQDKTPEKQLNEVKQHSRKRIQNNGSEDVAGSGETVEKMQEMFIKDLQELKDKQKR